jgi:hypothetical protein
LPAEWHFFVTSHGKSASDGVGGTLKRLAARATLHHLYDGQIIISHQMYEWAQFSIHNLNFDFVMENQYKEEGLLSSLFVTAETVHGTQKVHAFLLIKKGSS